MPKQKTPTPVSLPAFDRMTYKATFTTSGKIQVTRYHHEGGRKFERGIWEFQWTNDATWECSECTNPTRRAGTMPGYHAEFVPEPVALKVREFVTKEVKVIGKSKAKTASA